MEYTSHNWRTGETVTSNKLNNMEEGISDAASEINKLDGEAIKMPEGENGQILEKDSSVQGGVKWVDKSSTGTHVEANPSGEATIPLTKIKIDETNYNIPQTDTRNLATKQELQQGLSGKQDTIADLEQIRTRADEGHTALQPLSGAQENNFASFDSNGGIKDSGCNESTFIKGVKQNGTSIQPVGGVVDVTVQDGASAYDLYVDSLPAGTTPLSPEAWLASLKANIGAFKFVSYDQSAESAFTTGGIGTTYSSTIDSLVAGTDTTPDVILLMNNTDGTTQHTKTFMIATQDDGNSGFEFIYAGNLQDAMPSNVLTDDSSVFTELEQKADAVIVHTKNLADYVTQITGFSINTSVKIATTANAVCLKFPCKTNTTYTFSKMVDSMPFKIAYFDDDNIVAGLQGYNMQTGTIASNTSLTITTGANAKCILAYVYHANTTPPITLEQIISTLQIEEGSVATEFVPAGWTAIDNIARSKADYVIANYSKPCKIYMSPNGNDSNDGKDSSHPVATFNKAKELLADGGELVLLEGDYENFGTLDFSDFAKITGIGKVRLIYYTQKITSATQYQGNIYMAHYTGSGTTIPITNAFFLYLHDVDDIATLIASDEMHPLQRGRICRMPSTRIYKVNSIQEIVDSSLLAWWYDETNKDIYFSLPNNTDLSVNPVIMPSPSTIESSKERTVEIRNISILYNNILLTRISGILDNVSVGMGTQKAGEIRCDFCKSLLLRNCEAYAAYTNINGAQAGDGVNTHASSGDKDKCVVTLENCWLHDNADDGESCHEGSTTIHYGSLVEYNGNGVTPAAGGGTQCHGVISRKNRNDYAWTFPTTGSGVGFSAQGGVLYCEGCYAEGNNRGYYASSNSIAKAINSVAKDNGIDFGSTVGQINCVTLSS